MATMNEDGNVIGRVGALAVIALALWGVNRVMCGPEHCPMPRGGSSCCPGEDKAAGAAPAAAATPAPAAKPATR